MIKHSKHVSKTGFALPAAALALAGCVNLSPDIVYPLGTVAPLEPSLLSSSATTSEASIRTAKSGDILFTQSVESAAVYVLENDVEPDGNISLAVQLRTLDLKKGEKFFVGLAVGQYPALVACSVGRPAVHIPRLNQTASASGKICLELETIGDDIEPGSVRVESDRLTSDRFFFPVDGAFGITEEASPYQKLTRWDPQLIYKVTPPAELRRFEGNLSEDQDAPSLALRFMETAEGYQLEPVYVRDGLPQPTEEAPLKIEPEEGFPTTITVDGAEIELLAITNSVLAYRINSGFDGRGFFVMDLPE